MIEVRNLTKKFIDNNETILQEVNLTIYDKGLYYLLGKTGSGKTTLISLISGLDNDYLGFIKVDDKELKNLTNLEREEFFLKKVAISFQKFEFDEDDSVLFYLEKEQRLGKKDEDKIEKLLTMFGLLNKKHSKIKFLSGGEKKRLLILSSFLLDKKYIFLDEPFSSLNQEMRIVISRFFKEESKKRAIFIITHDKETIEDEATILGLENGKLLVIKENKCKSTDSTLKVERRKFTFRMMIKDMFIKFLHKRDILILAVSTLIISLFSLSFSSLLSTSVKDSLNSTLSSYMNQNSLVISPKEQNYIGEYESASYQELLDMALILKEYVLSVEPFYLNSLNDIFLESQKTNITMNEKSLSLSAISLDSFLEPRSLSEEEINMNLNNNEIILVLDDKNINSLFSFIYHELPHYGITEEDFLMMRNLFKNERIELNISSSKDDYFFSSSFHIRDIYWKDKNYIIAREGFNEYFINEKMHFRECYSYLEYDGFNVLKTYGLKIKRGKEADFLVSFLKERKLDDYLPQVLANTYYYDAEDLKTHNHILVYTDYQNKISLSEIKEISSHLQSTSIRYSTSLYTYTASDFISGFQKPFFFSAKKEKLNEIMDTFSKSDNDFGVFQGTSIDVDDDVIKADLTSSLNEEGLSFYPLNKNEKIMGSIPSSFSEIGISKGLAKLFFEDYSLAIDQDIYTLILEGVEQRGDLYYNIFSQGKVKVKAIYDEDSYAIYQDSLFPLAYSFQNSLLNVSECHIQEAILEVDLETYEPSFYLEMLEEYDSYDYSFPMYEVMKNVDKSIDNISKIFFFFSFFMSIISIFLLLLSFYLILQRDKKEISQKLIFGYKRKDIIISYFFLLSFIGLISYIFSTLLCFFVEHLLSETLNNILSNYSSRSSSYFISLLLLIAIIIILFVILAIKITKIPYSECLSKNNRFHKKIL